MISHFPRTCSPISRATKQPLSGPGHLALIRSRCDHTWLDASHLLCMFIPVCAALNLGFLLPFPVCLQHAIEILPKPTPVDRLRGQAS